MQQEFIFPHSFEVLPPAAPCIDALPLFASLRALCSKNIPYQQTLRVELAEGFDGANAQLARSGKHSLFQVFLALASCTSKRVVALSAYTCPDIAAAALRAGFRLRAVDVEKDSLGFSAEGINSLRTDDLAALVLSNLYGIPDSLPTEVATKEGFLLIDDACQGGLSLRGETPVGSSPESIGILSFGRGKAFSGVGGGAILLPNSVAPLTSAVAAEIQRLATDGGSKEQAGHLNWLDTTKDALSTLTQWCFQSPRRYRLPASLPFLGLGQTECSLEFETGPISLISAAHALSQLHRRGESRIDFISASQRWAEALKDLPLIQPAVRQGFVRAGVVPLRFPLIFPTMETREKFLYEAALAGLGASGSYPAPLQAFEPLQPYLESRPTLNAERLARTIVTLPVHSYVKDSHVEQTFALLKRILN